MESGDQKPKKPVTRRDIIKALRQEGRKAGNFFVRFKSDENFMLELEKKNKEPER